MTFHLFDGKDLLGPFTVEQLRARPGFGADTMVCAPGAVGPDAWRRAGALPEFAQAFKPAAASGLARPADKVVFIVDDDENVRGALEMSAIVEGFQVVTAVNGLDAAAKFKQREPDLIVTDLMMPGQGGYEFLRSLQAAGSGRVPIFVITGSFLDSSTIDLIRHEANVVEFFNKPLRMAEFLQALHTHLKTDPSAAGNGR